MREWLMSLIREAVRAEMSPFIRSLEELGLSTASDVEEIKEVLLEASRIKAIRDGGKPEEIKPRQPVRQRAFRASRSGVQRRRLLRSKARLTRNIFARMI